MSIFFFLRRMSIACTDSEKDTWPKKRIKSLNLWNLSEKSKGWKDIGRKKMITCFHNITYWVPPTAQQYRTVQRLGREEAFVRKKNPLVPVESESCQPMSQRRKHLVSTFHVPEFRPQALIFHLIISSIYGFDGNLLRLWKYWEIDSNLNFGSSLNCDVACAVTSETQFSWS